MNWIYWVLAAGALLGGVDRILGNRWGFGEAFERAILLLGPMALSMAGILCLVPLLSRGLERAVAPLCAAIGLSPAVLSGLLAIDMGGFSLAQALAETPAVGLYCGVIVSATLGCTLSFTLPVSFGVLDEGAQRSMLDGALTGLLMLPAGLLAGGLLCGVPLWTLLCTSLPVLLLCGGMGLLCARRPRAAFGILRGLSWFLRLCGTVGLVLGAIAYLTKTDLVPGVQRLDEAAQVCVEIAIVMLGSLPLAELLRRLLQWWFRRARLPLGADCTAAILAGSMSILSGLSLLKSLQAREQRTVCAFLVAGGSLVVHLCFVLAVAPGALLALLAAKLIAGLLAAVVAYRRGASAE